MSILTQLGKQLRRTLLPQDCLLCSAASDDSPLCPDCVADLPAMPAGVCPRCGNASSCSAVCGRCQRHPPAFDALIPLYPYDFPVDQMIQHLKYAHQLALADWFGRQLADVCRHTGADLVIPLPLHPRRLAERGFNQSVEIARSLARGLDLPLDLNACSRRRDTAPQAGLSLLARRRNMHNAFACACDLTGRHVLLIDDVVTTGATVGECARTLKLHGARQVTVATVARTLND